MIRRRELVIVDRRVEGRTLRGHDVVETAWKVSECEGGVCVYLNVCIPSVVNGVDGPWGFF